MQQSGLWLGVAASWQGQNLCKVLPQHAAECQALTPGLWLCKVLPQHAAECQANARPLALYKHVTTEPSARPSFVLTCNRHLYVAFKQNLDVVDL